MYDPRHPHRFVHSRRELNARSEDWFSPGVPIVVETALLLGMVLVILHENGIIH